MVQTGFRSTAHSLVLPKISSPALGQKDRIRRLISWMRAGWILCVMLMTQPQTQAQLRINEFMASNVTVFPDMVDFDDYADWIELHNPSPNPINLHGYFLSDREDQPAQWGFPEGIVMAPGSFLVVRADGFGAYPGDQAIRAFSPWDSFTVDHLHTNFKLSAGGETILLSRVVGAMEDGLLITRGSTWSYNDSGEDPDPDWYLASLDDSNWASGQAPLGYGNSDDVTRLDYGPSSNNKRRTYWVRKKFTVESKEALMSLSCQIQVDDGAILYLNGIEILRLRMPNGVVDSQTLATSTVNKASFQSFELDPSLLKDGENLLAAAIHQANPSSSDIRWDFELKAGQALGDLERVDQIDFTQQYPDVSMGRLASDPEQWVLYGIPTPEAANLNPPLEILEPSASVQSSLPSGYYSQPVHLILQAADASAIHFTTDGSTPGPLSPQYSSPLDFSQTTIVRARTLAQGKMPGPILTVSLLQDPPPSQLPSLSLVVDPELFFGDSLGIYSNVHKGREALVCLEYFNQDLNPIFQINAGAKIAGENIWRFAQKPLTISLRGKYGNDLLAHQLFEDERVGSISQFVLRNGGDNWDNAMIRDAMTPFLLRGQSPSDVQNYRPCVVYLNGDYWGIYNLRSKLDATWFTTHHHLAPGSYDYLEYGHVIGNQVALLVAEGDTQRYLALEAEATQSDLSDIGAYEEVAAQLHLESLLDYVAMEDFVYNTSWRHNREFWCERQAGAQWHWVIPDLDRGFRIENVASSLIDNFDGEYPLIHALLDQVVFRQKLAQRYAAHLGSTLHPSRIAAILDGLSEPLDQEMERHIQRWKQEGGIASMESRQRELDEIKQFARERAPHVIRGMQNHLAMGDTTSLSLAVIPPAGGRLKVCGIPALLEWNGTMELFKDAPVELEAEPAPGYRFIGWQEQNQSHPKQVFSLTQPMNWTAVFEPTQQSMLPSVVDTNQILEDEGHEWIVVGTTHILRGSQLTIRPGVTLLMGPQADLIVEGQLDIQGTATEPVTIKALDPSKPWGSLVFQQAEGLQTCQHLILRDGGLGPDPTRHRGAITNLGSQVELSWLDIASATTLYAEGGETSLTHSRIYSPYTGDGINIKRGIGRVEHCTFMGNQSVDTDAIDFDGVVDGIIRYNRIHAFRGANSDGIDVGEGCINLLVADNLIYRSSDKGISVGQGSEVIALRNLIVGCALGVGVKDKGSSIEMIQNTLVDNTIAVAAYEKNLLKGGGKALVDSCIIASSGQSPLFADALSSIQAQYCLSDQQPIDGAFNRVAEVGFLDPFAYNFELAITSPALNQGNPALPADPDGTQADIGAYYLYQPEDYPFVAEHAVVINELLAHSHDAEPDWIELYNQSGHDVDLTGWYLSDDGDNLRKYAISKGTILPAGGYLVFREDSHFGVTGQEGSENIPFALSEHGESVHLYYPDDGLFLEYHEKEAFGPSATGVSKGRYIKPGSGTVNFVALSSPSPGAANAYPLVGPLVISEIMYHPEHPDEPEFIELLNISDVSVTLWDEIDQRPWSMTSGVSLSFPEDELIVLAPGEYLLLTDNKQALKETYALPESQQILPWESGSLSNKGERIELSRPGDQDALGIWHDLRVDRVNFEDGNPWPIQADGMGFSLQRIEPQAYGNDPDNWFADLPSPGYATATSVSASQAWNAWLKQFELVDPLADPDGDGMNHLEEFARGTHPLIADEPPQTRYQWQQDQLSVSVAVSDLLPPDMWEIQHTQEVQTGNWTPWEGVWMAFEQEGQHWIEFQVPTHESKHFYRLVFLLPKP